MIVWMLLIGGVITVIALIGAVHIAYKKTFRYRALILKENGWEQDIWKIIKLGPQRYAMKFYHNPGKTIAPPEKVVYQMLDLGDNDVTEMPLGDMRKLARTFALFYSPQKGQYFPIQVKTATIKKAGEDAEVDFADCDKYLSILDTPNREFIVSELKRINDLSSGLKEKLIAAGIILGAGIIGAVVLVVIISLAGDMAGDIAQKASSGLSLVDLAQGAVGG